MTFFEKFSLLAQRRGESPRAVALSVGIDPSAVAQWKRRGSRPNPSTAVLLADYFDIPVEFLLDDSRDLPPEPAQSSVLEEEQVAYDALYSKPIKTASALAKLEHGENLKAGQTKFERHLAELRAMREQAERRYPRDPAAASDYLDSLTAAYITALEKRANPL